MYNFAIIKLLKMHKFCFPAEICKKRFHFASIYVIIRRSTEENDSMTDNTVQSLCTRCIVDFPVRRNTDKGGLS